MNQEVEVMKRTFCLPGESWRKGGLPVAAALLLVFPLWAGEEPSQTSEPASAESGGEIQAALSEAPELEAIDELQAMPDGVLGVPAGKILKNDIEVDGSKPVVIDGELKGDLVSWGGKVTVNGTLRGSVVTFGGELNVPGAVTRDLVAFGGKAKCSGQVEGSVVAFGGVTRFQPGARVGEDVVVLGGVIEGADQASIEGKTVSKAPFGCMTSEDFCTDFGSFFDIWFSAVAIALRIFMVLLWIGVALLLEALMGERIGNAAQNMREHWLRNTLIGFLWCFVALALFVIFILLCFVLIGVPFLLLLLVFAAAVWVFGMVAVFRMLGEALARAMGQPRMSTYAAVSLGALLVALIKIIPVLGTLAGLVLALLGMGTALMTRFGKSAANGAKVKIVVESSGSEGDGTSSEGTETPSS